MKDASPRRYPALRAIWLSFYSRDLYRDVRSNWKGTGLGLLCAVFALLGVLLAARFQVWTAAEVPGFAEKIPPFQVAQGEFTSPVAQPYRIDYPKGCIMVDTTGKFRSIDQVPGVEGFETAYLVTKDGYSVRQVRRGKVEDRYHPFKPTTHFAATRGDIDRWTKALVRWAGPGLYVVYLPIFLPIE
ncbi:MAG TPA: DUF1189 family protein, partial [bacterium]|nr:DUF1189 family protein [bacterium]